MNNETYYGLTVRLSVTQRCQLRCRYCLPRDGRSQPLACRALNVREVRTLIQALHDSVGIQKLRFTGGEPLLRSDLSSLIAVAASLRIPDIALTTNGQLLAQQAPILRQAGLHRVNVSLDSLRPQTFAHITHGGRLEKTLAGIRAALESQLYPVKLNMVVMRGVNLDEVNNYLRFGLETGCHVRFLELMPIGIAKSEFANQFVSSKEVRALLATQYVWLPNLDSEQSSSRNWTVCDAHGRTTTCGFISPTSHPFCTQCRRVRISATGELIGCLVRGQSLSVSDAIAAAANGDNTTLVQRISEAFEMKQGKMFSAGADCMASIGG